MINCEGIMISNYGTVYQYGLYVKFDQSNVTEISEKKMWHE